MLPADSIDPRLLSLAMAFVPYQSFETPYEPALAFSRGTIFPSLDKPLPRRGGGSEMTEREKLLNRVRMYDFALVDVIEYLDGHPKNTAALAYYSEMRHRVR